MSRRSRRRWVSAGLDCGSVMRRGPQPCPACLGLGPKRCRMRWRAAGTEWWRRTLAPQIGALRSVYERLAEFVDPPRYDDADAFGEHARNAQAAVGNLVGRWPDSLSDAPEVRMLRDILAFLEAQDDVRSKANEAFVSNELVRSRALFDRTEARPLTDEPLRETRYGSTNAVRFIMCGAGAGGEPAGCRTAVRSRPTAPRLSSCGPNLLSRALLPNPRENGSQQLTHGRWKGGTPTLFILRLEFTENL